MTTLLDQPDTIYTLAQAQENCEVLNDNDLDGWTYAITCDGNMTGGYIIKAYDNDNNYAGTF